MLIGVAAFFCVALFDYRNLASLSVPLYIAGMLALALLPLLGVSSHRAKRWYDLGPFNAQPSEPMKYVIVLIVATYFTCRRRIDRLRDLAVPLALTGAPMLLIIRQPDLGSAMLLLPSFFVIAFVAGVPLRNLIVLVLAGALLAVAAWFTPGALTDYQKGRLIGFVDPDRDPNSPASFNAARATLAVTGGGATGQGWGQGRLNRLRRIPERHTDFIFPVIAEEWGFFRTSGMVALYILIMVFLARIASRTHDRFGRMVSVGVLSVFAFQSLLHMAISLRLAPITGLTLPLVSYGGSSLVSTFGGLGLISSVAARRPGRFALTEPED
jgi:rod shape determining protein RodA